jgi:putative FmdB family regulatory protein
VRTVAGLEARNSPDPAPLLALAVMPIYEYRCPKGHVFERFQRMSDPAPEACEICGEGPVEVVLYPVAVHFKGSGFYSTDYGRGGKKKDASKDGGEKTEKSETGEKSEKQVEKKAAEA